MLIALFFLENDENEIIHFDLFQKMDVQALPQSVYYERVLQGSRHLSYNKELWRSAKAYSPGMNDSQVFRTAFTQNPASVLIV